MNPPLSANESQAGKPLRQRLVRAIYGETAYQIARRDGGVGSVDESLGAALISGKPFPRFLGSLRSLRLITHAREN